MFTHYIVTFTKSHHGITQRQFETLRKLGVKDELILNDCVVKVNNIAEILNAAKYFESYPQNRPTEVRNDFEDKYGKIGNQQVRVSTKNAGKLMLQGMAKYINENADRCEDAKKMYESYASG